MLNDTHQFAGIQTEPSSQAVNTRPEVWTPLTPPEGLTFLEQLRWRKEHGSGKFGYLGVSVSNSKRNPWQSSIIIPGRKRRHTGCYKTAIHAALGYDVWSIYLWGEDAVTNIIEPTPTVVDAVNQAMFGSSIPAKIQNWQGEVFDPNDELFLNYD